MTKEATLKIGNTINSLTGTIKELSTAVNEIFKSAKVNGIEQETIRVAINALTEVAKIENIAVSHSIFKGDKIININDDNEDENETTDQT